MEIEAKCPPYPDEFEIYPMRPVFGPQVTWDKWADANQNYAIALEQRITRQKKWRAEHWKECPIKGK